MVTDRVTVVIKLYNHPISVSYLLQILQKISIFAKYFREKRITFKFMKELKFLVRNNIMNLDSADCERDNMQYKEILLDANENPYNSPLNRYPDTKQTQIKEKLSKIMRLMPDCMLLCNGIDEIIDLIYRCFAEPKTDNVVMIEPSCGLYKHYAKINDVELRKVELDESFQITANNILSACDDKTKVIWISSPNDPTGNELNREEINSLIDQFEGIVVLNESYSDFSKLESMRMELHKHPNLIILNSFSAAWGCAGLNIGIAFAFPEIIDILNKVKPIFNINTPTQELILKQLNNRYEIDKWINILLMERDRMVEAFKLLPDCEKVFHSDSNFLLIKMHNAKDIYRYLRANGIKVCDVSDMPLCNNCLRITIGSKSENSELLSVLRQYETEYK